jgi:hypothetical protein
MRLLFALLVLAAAPLRAWDNGGHQIVDAIAYAHLNPKAKQAVDQLAAQMHSSRGNYDAITLGCWMDDIRDDPAVSDDRKFRTWHYIDIPIDPNAPKPSFDPGTDDVIHGNAVQALKRAVAVLKGGSDPYIKDQATALAMVMHLVGDIHQPLHCATNTILVHGNALDDRGGNLELVSNGPPSDAKFPLHRFWDEAYRATFDETSGDVDTNTRFYTNGGRNAAFDSLVAEIDRLGLPTDKANVQADFEEWGLTRNDLVENFEGWARESNAVARNLVYPGLINGEDPKHCRLSSAYVNKARECARLELAYAGHKLAVLLNMILGEN